jgi:hypothetical protein
MKHSLQKFAAIMVLEVLYSGFDRNIKTDLSYNIRYYSLLRCFVVCSLFFTGVTIRRLSFLLTINCTIRFI